MTEFLAQYQCSPVVDPEFEKAYFLALRYAVRTEHYDRTLPHVIWRGEADLRPDCRPESNENARRELGDLHALNRAAGVEPEIGRRASERVAQLTYEDQQEQLQKMPADLRQLCANLARGDANV